MKKTLLCYFDYKNQGYTPLDLGYVKAYARKHTPDVDIDILRVEATKTAEEAQKEAYYLASFNADMIIFFLDNVLWSMMFSLAGTLQIIKKIKAFLPHTKIAIQSYKIKPELTQQILNDFPEIEFIIHGEPEIPLSAYHSGETKTDIPGLSYRGAGGSAQTNPEPLALANLDELPSPYLSGVLDVFLKEKTNGYFFMQSARGCPFRCHYCFRSVKFSKVRTFGIDRVMDEMQYLIDRGARYLFMLDDCFVVKRDRFVAILEAYKKRFSQRKNMPEMMIMSRPEFLDEEIIQQFLEMNITYIQLGLQTIHPEAQFLMGRGVTLERFKQITQWLKKANIKICLDVIIGLPHDDLGHCLKTLDFANEIEPEFLQVKQLYQNPNTLFDLHPEKYGIEMESLDRPYHVPFVEKTNTFSNTDMQKASEYANEIRQSLPPGRQMKLITQFHWFSEYSII